MIVLLKLGGSLLTVPDLAERIGRVLSQRSGAQFAVVVGGGGPADLVREWQRLHALTDEVAHVLALHAMSFSAALVEYLLPRAQRVSDERELTAAMTGERLPLLSAERWLARAEHKGDRPLPHSWEATSDSIAAWMARELRAGELILLKSVARPNGGIADAAHDGLVDRAFVHAARGVPRISWVNARTDACEIESWIG